MVKWTLISTHHLVWRAWDDDEQVVYHPGTGDTHILNGVAAEILAQLENRGLTSSELTDCCAAVFGIEPDESFRNHVTESLEQFDELGLIEIAP